MSRCNRSLIDGVEIMHSQRVMGLSENWFNYIDLLIAFACVDAHAGNSY